MSESVQLFHTCLVNEIDPEVGMAAVRLLERLGYRVEVPLAQTCCGQPAYNAGFHDEAKVAARHTLRVLSATTGEVVIPSGSCADMVIHQYEVLFRDEPEWREKAHAVGARCRELSQFLAEKWPAMRVRPRLAARVAYHPSCHLLRGLGVRDAPLTLLRAIEGVSLVEVKDQEECCGFGGLFSVKQPEISGSMLEQKMASVTASGADRLVSCDLGCLMHLGGGLRRRRAAISVQHLAQLLDEALA
jgi:L-lactate dehydrogenase complex protein LldE